MLGTTRKSTFLLTILFLLPFFMLSQNAEIKAEINKQAKKAIKDGEKLKSMKDLAVISVWGVDWHARGMAGPGDIEYGANRRIRESWMPEIFSSFKPRLEEKLGDMLKESGRSLEALSFAGSDATYQNYAPTETEPKKGRGFLVGTMDGFKFLDDDPADIKGASAGLNVDGVITIRYMIWPAALPTKPNKLKLWIKIFDKEGTLVYHGKMYSTFKAGPPKFRKLENYPEFLPKAEEKALENLSLLFQKSCKKLK